MPVNLRQLVRESTFEVLQEDLTAPVDEGLDLKYVKRLVIAGVLLWATLTQDGRSAVKQAYKALQLNTAVPQQTQQQIQNEVPYTGTELDKFIQSQMEHRDKIDKEVGPVSKKILSSPSFVRDEVPKKEGFDPTSAGPNPEATEGTQYNPYPQWNAEMRKMEENEIKEVDPHGNYAKDAGAGQFDSRTFGPTTKVSQL